MTTLVCKTLQVIFLVIVHYIVTSTLQQLVVL